MKIDTFRFHLIMEKFLPFAKKTPYYNLIQYNACLSPDVFVGIIYADHSNIIWVEIRNRCLLEDGGWIRAELDSFEEGISKFSVAFDHTRKSGAGYESLRKIYNELISTAKRV